MMVEECVCNRAGMNCEPPLMVPEVKSEAVDNGFGCGIGIDVSEGSSGENLRTYKRRKQGNDNSGSRAREDGRVCTESPSADQACDTMNDPTVTDLHGNPCEQANLLRSDCQAAGKSSDDSLRHWRNLVLENVYRSVSESEGGIRDCIVEALKVHGQRGCTASMKASVDKGRHRYPSQAGGMCNGSRNTAEGNANLTSNGLLSESSQRNNNELCQHTFFSIIVSEKFDALCKLLFENFQGINVDSFFDYSLINTRMKEGAYECSPKLFFTDIQQVWRKLQNIGTEMASLSESLLDMSRSSYSEKVGSSKQDTTEEGKYEFCTRAPDCQTKLEQLETHADHTLSTCHHCGEKADGGDCLVCDSCEEMYHVSCIEPAVGEIPPKSWFCAKCTASGIGSPHENCVVCVSRNAPTTLINGVDDINLGDNKQTFVEFEEKLNCIVEDGLQQSNGSESSCHCIICGCETEEGETYRICGHPFCPSKYYHVRCLTSKQLKSYGPRWYCPSCLCRVCLDDKDDDKIVLCDGCDHAYHIYCMQPPHTSIPRGKWFCTKCDVGIHEIRKRRKVYEIVEKEQKQLEEGNITYESFKKKHRNGEVVLDKAEGVDMLLNAANTLNIEEKLAASRTKS